MMIAPPAMVDMALAMEAPPCCSRMARPSDTAPPYDEEPSEEGHAPRDQVDDVG